MEHPTIVGYVFEAALHCPNCSRDRFGDSLDSDSNPPTDREGNPVSPVFAGDEPGDCGDYCDDCHEPLDNMPDDWDAQLLDAFIKANSQDMFEALSAIVVDLQATLMGDPAEYTEHGCDEPSIDIRLCIDIYHCREGGSWTFRTGDSSYDQRHSEYCAASSVTPDTGAAKLLADLIEQLA